MFSPEPSWKVLIVPTAEATRDDSKECGVSENNRLYRAKVGSWDILAVSWVLEKGS